VNIGQAAKRSGISAKMIRYYEEIGLLPAPKRSESGYRDYSDADIRMLGFIQHARELGFSSEQMKELLGLWQNEVRQSSEVKQRCFAFLSQFRGYSSKVLGI
jgi:MerR family transcriptional regulator, copper efflux regulator